MRHSTRSVEREQTLDLMRHVIMMTAKPVVANLYNPHEQSKHELLDRFVVRHDMFRELYHGISAASSQAVPQHFLLEGPRGTGKTTLLLRLNYEVENDARLRECCVSIVLKEEAYYGIRRLYTFWKTIAQELQAKDKRFSGLYEQMRAAYNPDIPQYLGEKQYEKTCCDLLLNALAAQSKTAVLFIDNFGELLYNFTGQEMYRLYTIMKSQTPITLVAASSMALEALRNDENGFLYALFEKKRLEGLSKQETAALLLELGRTYGKDDVIERLLAKQPGRVESLRILTGGVIRTMVLLFEIFTEQEESDTVADLDAVLDRVTPLYKSRMDMLTPLQREIVNAIALHWEAVSVDEIAQATNLHRQEVQAILQDLEHLFLIERLGDVTPLPLFRLKERFFNIWYLMRLSTGGGHARVTWLLHFLESWYGKHEFQDIARKYITSANTGATPPKSALYLTEAFLQSGALDQETEHRMLHAAKRLIADAEAPLADASSDIELQERGQAFYQQELYEQAVALFTQLKRKDDRANFRIGYALTKLSRFDEAIPYFLDAANGGHLEAMLRLALIYQHHLRDAASAEQWYRMASDRGHTDAMLNLGHLYCYALQDYSNARKYYILAAQTGHERLKELNSPKAAFASLKKYVLSAFEGFTQDHGRGEALEMPGVRENYRQAMRRTTAEALYQLGNLHTHHLRNRDKAERYYEAAAQLGHVKAMLYLGDACYFVKQDIKNAEKYYLMAAKEDDLDAMMNLALLYHTTLNHEKKAEKWYLAAAANGEISAMNGIAWLYFEQNRERAAALDYARHALLTERNMHTAHTAACVYLWNNLIDEAFELAREFLFAPQAYDEIEQDILYFLMFALAKEQYQRILELFRAPELDLRERFTPMFYALLHCIGDPAYDKLPPELAEPVRDIIARIQNMSERYA